MKNKLFYLIPVTIIWSLVSCTHSAESDYINLNTTSKGDAPACQPTSTEKCSPNTSGSIATLATTLPNKAPAAGYDNPTDSDSSSSSGGSSGSGTTTAGQTCTSSSPYTGDAQANSYCGLACQYYANSTQTTEIINLRYNACKQLSNYLQGFGDVNYATNTKKCKGACANYPGASP